MIGALGALDRLGHGRCPDARERLSWSSQTVLFALLERLYIDRRGPATSPGLPQRPTLARLRPARQS
jgi:hypothetical protein